MKLSKKKTVITSMAALAVFAGMSVPYVSAYLTDNETATNTFTVGKVQVDLEEPSYPGNGTDKTTNLVPNGEVAKDPKVENTGNNAAYVFIKMTVPRANVTLVKDNGEKGTKEVQELFYFKKNADGIDKHLNNFDTNWVELTSTEGTATATERTYVFGYNAAVEANHSTNPLFEKIQLKNVLENEITTGEAKNIKIDTYAIQADNIVGIDTTTLDAKTLTNIYTTYMKQNENAAAAKDANRTGAKDLKGNPKA